MDTALYLGKFLVYSLAMTGFLGIAFYVYKKSMSVGMNETSRNFLKVKAYMKLSPSKTVYVVEAGCERFLVAGDPQNTTLLAKLADYNDIKE